jgi:hypothetical protein
MGTLLTRSITTALQTMDHATHSSIASLSCNIADDVLRDLYVRGKYRDVILHDFG